ncbi:MAG: hypothetical protein R3F42_13955 [Pseudomonadota bacterium]
MNGRSACLLALWLTAVSRCAAAEHPACTDPAFDWYALSPGELRAIAGSCSSTAFTELNYQRAYLTDLLGEDAAAAGLISWSTFERQPDMASHGIHMLLLEQLAPLYIAAVPERLALLNQEYEIRNEIAELWLRGYGTLATRLRELHSQNSLYH